jgi:phenylalanyl-tRNA synthetase alpha chain
VPADAPPSDGLELSLSSAERALLRHLQRASAAEPEESLGSAAGLLPEVARGALQRLRSKGLAVIDERASEKEVLTRRGEEALARGLPERRMLARLTEAGTPLPSEALVPATLEEEELPVAVGVLRRQGRLAPGAPFSLATEGPPADAPLPEEAALQTASRGEPVPPEASKSLRRRGLLAVERTVERRWAASEEGHRLPLGAVDLPEEGALTAARIADGSWRQVALRPYDVRAAVPFLRAPAPHPYLEFLERFADLLVGLGFSEEEGPLLETEFWNADVLYMPQEHPARSVHDVFHVKGIEGRLPDPGLLARVADAHEGKPLPGESEPISTGWRVPFRPEISRRSVLRSQTTAVSGRYLATRPRPPFRMFCIGRNFRPDDLDATHLLEFDQCEGLLGEEGTSMRELVGIFRALAEGIGIRELKIRPSYYPFTEPSVDGYVRHPTLGWIEVFPGGLLRPEVLRPLGISVPVAAWGIGLTRLATAALGVADIRQLYEDDVEGLSGGR